MFPPAAVPPCPLLRRPDPALFAGARARIDRQYRLWAATSPAPLPAPGLVIVPELRCQSELYLPIAELRRVFHRFYRFSLNFPPHLNSTPFSGALSWADLYGTLPAPFQLSPNPARLLERLLLDPSLHCRFLFHSFLPARYNGAGFGRYPEQRTFLGELCRQRRQAGHQTFRCLDAACGSGEGTWELAEQVMAAGWQPAEARIEGWTLDPLEVWAARQRCLPHAPARQTEYHTRTEALVMAGWGERITFSVVNLLDADPAGDADFDLILCNGLLGGPLLNQPAAMLRLIERLAAVLRPGGYLLAADRFHGGWKQQSPGELLGALLAAAGLRPERLGEGMAGIRT
ncbi:class I SAM-dependent methyltransferase [Trichlorobacter ammonificans]|uniref:MCP methyltransferase, CheR-type n=1 Tax=Trichlorobacter ammonificans TaxID=2916410 RepID=A0ABM9D7E4_9BACT|nr:class I SAM-dependent methyltransferase [Trichlorobacter ammonificans]CAH2030308.1 MCP methyltransferase, CheR-type [Trichlorobacter ammonificans]